MPVTWSSLSERKLLMALIDPQMSPKWAHVARTMGPGFSGESCRQKYYKLRNQTLKHLEGDPISDPTTPTKRKATSLDGGSPAPKKRAKKTLKQEFLDGNSVDDTVNDAKNESDESEAGQDEGDGSYD